MPCHLSHSNEMTLSPILYWENLGMDPDHAKLWPPSEKYQSRVEHLSKNRDSANMSILLKDIRWADTGSYQCKVSISNPDTKKRNRIKGNNTVLLIYDKMFLDLTGTNNTMLRCTVNVTSHPSFVLSIVCNGQKPQRIGSDPGNYRGDLSYVSLTETVQVEGDDGRYECQLHLNKHLITSRSFDSLMGKKFPPLTGENRTNLRRNTDADAQVFPEPWFLYVGLLLVPIITLLCVLTPLLICKICVD